MYRRLGIFSNIDIYITLETFLVNKKDILANFKIKTNYES